MSCHTEICKKVYTFVKQWIDEHPEIDGVWDVFDVQQSLDVVISIHQSDGVRQLSIENLQEEISLKPDVEQRIRDWLENLSIQPTVKD